MPADSTVRIGIIGAGRFAETHLDQFARVDGAEVVAVCRRNEDALRELQRRYDIPSGYTDYRDMLSAGGIDAVSIVTPTSSHRRIAMDAISAKLHVFATSPLRSRQPMPKRCWMRRKRLGSFIPQTSISAAILPSAESSGMSTRGT